MARAIVIFKTYLDKDHKQVSTYQLSKTNSIQIALDTTYNITIDIDEANKTKTNLANYLKAD